MRTDSNNLFCDSGKHAAANAACCTPGASARLLAPASVMALARGWGSVLAIARTFNLLAAALGLLAVKPMGAKHFAAIRAETENPLPARGRGAAGGRIERGIFAGNFRAEIPHGQGA